MKQTVIFLIFFIFLSINVISGNYLIYNETFSNTIFSTDCNYKIGNPLNYNIEYNTISSNFNKVNLYNNLYCAVNFTGTGVNIGKLYITNTYKINDSHTPVGIKYFMNGTGYYYLVRTFNESLTFTDNSYLSFWCKSFNNTVTTKNGAVCFADVNGLNKFCLTLDNLNSAGDSSCSKFITGATSDNCLDWNDIVPIDSCVKSGSNKKINRTFINGSTIFSTINDSFKKNIRQMQFIIENSHNDRMFNFSKIDDIELYIFNGTNRLPEFNVSLDNQVCINSSTDDININISIDSFDIENDTIYYSYGINIFDNGLFFTEFNLLSCDDVDIYSINNEYGSFFKASYNKMGNGVYSLYYDNLRKCVIKLDNNTYNSTVNSIVYDKSIVFNLEKVQNYEPNIYFKMQFNNLTNINFLFTDTLNRIYNNFTIIRNTSNNLRLSSYGTFINSINYTNTNFTQFKLQFINNKVYVIVCDDFFCLSENIIAELNNKYLNSRLKYFNIIIKNHSIYLDDFIISTDAITNFSLSKPNNLTINGVGNKVLRVRVSDNEHLPNNYNEKIINIFVNNIQYCINSDIDTNSYDCFYKITNNNSLWQIILFFFSIPYGFICIVGLKVYTTAIGIIVLVFSAWKLFKSGITDLQTLFIYEFGIATILYLLRFLSSGVYIIFILIAGLFIGSNIINGSGG